MGNETPFHMNRQQRLGLIILLALLTMLLAFWRLMPRFFSSSTDTHEVHEEWDRFKAQFLDADRKVSTSDEPAFANDGFEGHRAELFYFDPNTVTGEELKRMGLPSRTIQTMLRYREKGGRFYKKEDLQKLYTLSDHEYQRIAPFVHIPSRGKNRGRPAAIGSTQAVFSFELNTVDSQALTSLRGIGPVLSARIIRYRTVLGGFAEVEQLREVYGLPDSTYQQIKKHFTVNVDLIKKININEASERILARHPYIGKEIARSIVSSRAELGSLTEAEITAHHLISAEKYRKIAPYLIF